MKLLIALAFAAFSSVVVAATDTLAATSSSSSTVGTTMEGEASTPVRIAVTCGGGAVDLASLSLSMGTFVGTLLQDSYNGLVELDDSDDSELSGVTFVGGGAKNTGVWKGSWGCDACVKDDDAETKTWELELVAGLIASGESIFHQVHTCTIAMTVDPAGPTTPADAEDPPNANIQVDCGKGIDMSKLSVAKGTYLAHAVQRSYAKAHGSVDGDDSSLTYVVYTTPTATALAANTNKLTRRNRIPGALAGIIWLCRLCPKDDDLLLGGMPDIKVTGAALMAWQAELVALLRESNFPAFRKITKCTIKMLPRVTDEAVVVAGAGAGALVEA